jgi:hypothetical protein
LRSPRRQNRRALSSLKKTNDLPGGGFDLSGRFSVLWNIPEMRRLALTNGGFLL